MPNKPTSRLENLSPSGPLDVSSERSKNGDRKAALVLSGGGARGAYSVGVVNALKDRGIRTDIICGTSSGALSAAMVAAGQEKELLQIWRDLSSDQVYSPMSKLSFVGSFFGNYTYPYFSSKPLWDLVRRSVDFERVRSSSKKLIVSAFDLHTGRVVRFFNDHPQLDLCLLASASIPVVFPPIVMEPYLLVDGGVTDNVPLKAAIEHGASTLYVVINSRKEDFSRRKIRNNLALTVMIMEASQYASIMDDTDHLNRINSLHPSGELHPVELILIQPSRGLELGTLEFSNRFKLNRALDLGYEDADRLLSLRSKAVLPSLKT